jgi:hypothetical protein
MSNATTSIILEKCIPKMDSTFVAKLRITYNRIQKYFQQNIHFTNAQRNQTQIANSQNVGRQFKIYFNGKEQTLTK